MAGRWSRMWDAERQVWVDVFLDLPVDLTTGRATTATQPTPILLGPDGKPVRCALPRRFGFGKPQEA
jgi:hypothetical protein